MTEKTTEMSGPSIAAAAVTAGGLFVKALAGQDWAGLAECFDEGIRLRALTPMGCAPRMIGARLRPVFGSGLKAWISSCCWPPRSSR
jgi:hypothetical protein